MALPTPSVLINDWSYNSTARSATASFTAVSGYLYVLIWLGASTDTALTSSRGTVVAVNSSTSPAMGGVAYFVATGSGSTTFASISNMTGYVVLEFAQAGATFVGSAGLGNSSGTTQATGTPGSAEWYVGVRTLSTNTGWSVSGGPTGGSSANYNPNSSSNRFAYWATGNVPSNWTFASGGAYSHTAAIMAFSGPTVVTVAIPAASSTFTGQTQLVSEAIHAPAASSTFTGLAETVNEAIHAPAGSEAFDAQTQEIVITTVVPQDASSSTYSALDPLVHEKVEAPSASSIFTGVEPQLDEVLHLDASDVAYSEQEPSVLTGAVLPFGHEAVEHDPMDFHVSETMLADASDVSFSEQPPDVVVALPTDPSSVEFTGSEPTINETVAQEPSGVDFSPVGPELHEILHLGLASATYVENAPYVAENVLASVANVLASTEPSAVNEAILIDASSIQHDPQEWQVPPVAYVQIPGGSVDYSGHDFSVLSPISMPLASTTIQFWLSEVHNYPLPNIVDVVQFQRFAYSSGALAPTINERVLLPASSSTYSTQVQSVRSYLTVQIPSSSISHQAAGALLPTTILAGVAQLQIQNWSIGTINDSTVQIPSSSISHSPQSVEIDETIAVGTSIAAYSTSNATMLVSIHADGSSVSYSAVGPALNEVVPIGVQSVAHVALLDVVLGQTILEVGAINTIYGASVLSIAERDEEWVVSSEVIDIEEEPTNRGLRAKRLTLVHRVEVDLDEFIGENMLSQDTPGHEDGTLTVGFGSFDLPDPYETEVGV